MEQENKHNPLEAQSSELSQIDTLEATQAEELLLDEPDISLEQMPDVLESAEKEKESIFVRTQLGRLALKIATDPIFNIGVAGFALNTAANTMAGPTVLNTAMAVASTAAASLRAMDISNKHFNEREQAELEAQQN